MYNYLIHGYWYACEAYEARYCPRTLDKLRNTNNIAIRNKILAPTAISAGMLGRSNYMPFNEPDVFCNKMIVTRPLLIVDELYPNNLRGEQPGLVAILNKITDITNPFESNTILTINGERFMFMYLSIHTNIYGAYLLSIDRDWNTPFYD